MQYKTVIEFQEDCKVNAVISKLHPDCFAVEYEERIVKYKKGHVISIYPYEDITIIPKDKFINIKFCAMEIFDIPRESIKISEVQYTHTASSGIFAK